LQRDALEAIDKAWAARTLTASRIAALNRQLAANNKTIAIYRKEYDVGRRSLIDLLNAENQSFNAATSLTSARGVLVFADYQLLAAMGGLLAYLNTAVPVDAAPLDTIPFGLLPARLPPVLLWSPSLIGVQQWDSDSLKVIGWPGADEVGYQPTQATFHQRWSKVAAPAAVVEAATALDPLKPVLAAEAPSEPLQLHSGMQN
jgi:outer membrane protein, adhesin transport system